MSNSVTLIGNLVEAPELRFTQSGLPLAKVRLAVNKRWKNQADEWEEETSFFGGMLWREAAERAADSLSKGDRVIVYGKLKQNSWTNDAGEKRSVVEVDIDEIGPSLRYATAQVSRVQREATSAPQSNASAYQAREDYGPDEAPF